MPFKRVGLALIGNNLDKALDSFRSLQQRLRLDPEIEYLKCGHMRLLSRAELKDSSHQVHYIPHHGIWQAGDQGKKLRVVFNASKPTPTGYSLNDVLHTGPKLQAELTGVLIRWRRH